MKDVDCYVTSDKDVQVIVIKKAQYSMSEREAIERAIELLRAG